MNRFRKHFPLLILSLFILLVHLPQTLAQGENRVALVVDYGDGLVQTSCIDFTEESLTGYEVLQRSNLPLTVGVDGAGTSICAIGDVGCPASDCFCQCTGGADCVFWSYWHGTADSWQFSSLGANNYVVHDGDVEGWRWGNGSTQTADPPPFYAFDDVCTVPPTPTPIPVVLQPTSAATAVSNTQPSNPTATMTQTAVPTTTPTPTSLPTNSPTPQPTATLVPTVVTGATASPTVDLSTPATPRPTVTAWVPTSAAEPTAVPDAAVTPTSEIIVVALPTVENEEVLIAATSVDDAIAITTPSAIAVNNQPLAKQGDSQPTSPAAARIGAFAEPETTTQLVPTSPETAVSSPSYAVFGLVLLALGFVWWQGKRTVKREA